MMIEPSSPDSFFDRARTWINNSVTLRLVTIGILVLLLLIPIEMIQGLIAERKGRQMEAFAEVSSKWGNAQTITGPVLTIPFKTVKKVVDENGSFARAKDEYVEVTEYLHFLPNDLKISGTVTPTVRHRGIYRVSVYNARVDIKGSFLQPKPELSDVKEADIQWDKAFVSLGLSDLRSIKNNSYLKWNDESVEFMPGLISKDVMETGIHVPIKLQKSDHRMQEPTKKSDLKKGDILSNLTIDTMAAEGKCLARLNNQVVFLRGGAPGDVVSARLTKIKSNFLEADVVEITSFSEHRTTPVCSHFGFCGGCSWQHIQYSEQLRYKQKQVADHFAHIGDLQFPEPLPILAANDIYQYRNKLDFTFTAERFMPSDELKAHGKKIEPGIGYHLPRSYDRVFDVAHCHLQADPSNAIRLFIKQVAIENKIPFFDLRKQVGFLRTLTLRNTNQHEMMLILQVAYRQTEWIDMILEKTATAFPQLTSVQFIVNGKKNDTMAGLDVECRKGKPYITEKMPKPSGVGDWTFRVSPKSFYQTNSAQAHTLYQEVFRQSDCQPSDVLYDLYSGTGTIGIFLSEHVKKVIGIEYVEEAVADARINAQINAVAHAEFFAGDMKDMLTNDFVQKNGKPTLVICDPPRSGMHEDVIKALLQIAPEKIVYVSCNPATQARDLMLLTTAYRITIVQPVDMFPHTTHVENVVRLDSRFTV